MDTPLTDLAGRDTEYQEDVISRERLRQLYNRYVKERESSILDAVAATAAVDSLLFIDQIDTDAIIPQMYEAYGLAFSNEASEMTLVEKLASLDYSEDGSIRNFTSNLEGKYFEVLVRDRLNAGEQVGDIQLGAGQIAKLANIPNQPDWDLQILNADDTVDSEIQLKATSSLYYAKQAIEKPPHIRVISTDEVADQVADDLILILESGISNEDLKAQVLAPMEDLLDSPLEELAELALPGLPLVLIATTEGAKVLMGRQTFQQAVSRSLERGTKTGAAIGTLATLVGAGFVSLPATFLTRVGIDRYRIQDGLHRRLRVDMESLRELEGLQGT